MEYKFNKTNLLDNLRVLVPITSLNDALSILTSLSIEFTKKEVIFSSTNLSIFIQTKINFETTDKETIIVPAKKFIQIINKMPEEEIILSKINTHLKIKSGKCEFELPLFDSKEYPSKPNVDGNKVEFKEKNLKDSLIKVSFACSEEGTRLELTGVLFDFNKNKLTLVATDGRRLALTICTITSSIQDKYIIPQQSILYLLNIIPFKDTLISMTISKEFGLIKFQYENIEFITKLIDIEYPEYKTVIPKDVPNILKINTTNFCQAIDRADLMTTLNSVAVELKLEKDKITIFKATQGLGKEQEEIEVNYKGQEFRIGFNSKYLLDVLNNINEKEIELRFKDESSPCLIKVKNKYIYLLLPILLK